MPLHLPSRGPIRPCTTACLLALAFLVVPGGLSPAAAAQAPTSNPANSPASIPAGAVPALPTLPSAKPPATSVDAISPKELRAADDAYLEGARQIAHKDLTAAIRSFERATQLNPRNRDYALALIVTRENRVTELVQNAANARKHGDTAAAQAMLAEADALDPDNRVVAQHFAAKPTPKPGAIPSSFDPSTFPAQNIASMLGGPVELAPSPNKPDLHLHGDPQGVIRNAYAAYGITVTFDPSVTGGPSINCDVPKVSFADAQRLISMLTDTFAVPVQAKTALIAKDTEENRDALMPQVEETIYLPGLTNDEMQELANVARNVFDVKFVTASATGGFMLIRGNENVLKEVNATYDDMLDGGTDILFDVTLYELDKTVTNNVGAALPSSISAFDLVSSATSLISANQTLINQAISSGLLKLTGNAAVDDLAELAILIAAGVSGSSEFTSLLGTLGSYGGLPLTGVTVASSTFNLALNSSDVRLLDAVQIRSSNHQPVSFRAGTRYPVVTAIYSSGVSSSLASSLSGLNINGTSVSSLLSQYLGTSSVSVPQFQFEDLGITLKMTPQIQHSDQVSLAVELKVEALAGTSINSIPILNNRTITSTIAIPTGQTAMLATLVSNTESKSLTGVPGLNDIPGFSGTEQDKEKDSTELLITITPHVVRAGHLHIASRRLAAIKTGPSQGAAGPAMP
jgi:hypothetical protein